MENNKKKLFKLYTIAEIAYQKRFSNISDINLFPEGWYTTENYKMKIDILSEALKNNVLIINTQKYQEIIEGVRHK